MENGFSSWIADGRFLIPTSTVAPTEPSELRMKIDGKKWGYSATDVFKESGARAR